MAWTDRYRREDERVWRELMDRAARNSNRGTSDEEQPAESNAPENDGAEDEQKEEPKKFNPDGSYDTDDLGRIAYDENGKLLKPPKKPKPPKPPLSRNLRSKIHSSLGGIIGSAIGGGVGGAIGSRLASPRFRRNAINHADATAHTAPAPRAEIHDDPLDEPFVKDGDKTLAQRALDRAEELQTGSKGLSDYEGDYKYNRDRTKWGVGDEENESIKSVITEALKQFRPKI